MEITVSNFSHSNIEHWISGYSHKELVEFAIYCTELAIDLHKGDVRESKAAIENARGWVQHPTEENKDKCKYGLSSPYKDVEWSEPSETAEVYAISGAATRTIEAVSTADRYASTYAALAATNASEGYSSIKDKVITYIIAKSNKELLNSEDVLVSEAEGLKCEIKDLQERCSLLVKDKVELIEITESLIGAVTELNYRLSFTAKPQGFAGWVDKAKRILAKYK